MIERVRNRIRRERRRLVVEADLRRMRRQVGQVFGPIAGDRGTALIVSLSDFAYQVKTEGMLAQGLALEGLTPVAVVPPWPDAARGYFDLFGVRTTTLADFAQADDDAAARREIAAVLDADLDVAGLMEIRFRHTEIGRHVLSTVSRMLHEGALDVREPRVRALVERIAIDVARSTFAAERLLDHFRPELVLCNERNYAGEAPLSDIALARGVNVVQFVSAFQDDALVFKRYTQETKRIHPRSLSDESWSVVKSMPWGPDEDAAVEDELRARYENRWGLARRNQEWTSERDPQQVLHELGLDPGKRTAVVFSHVLWDANMFWGEDLFADQEEWLVETVRAACANDRVNWIVKLHPANVWKLRREGRQGEERNELTKLVAELGGLPPHVAVLPADSDVATKTIFSLLDWGITIRGSVGIELPCLGIPVLTAGTGFYADRGFTVDSSSSREYLARLASIEAVPPPSAEQVELARRHAYALFRLRPIRFTSFSTVIRPLREMGHPLDYDLRVELSTREELEHAADLRAFGDWAVRSRELDYLGPLPAGAAVAGGYDRPS